MVEVLNHIGGMALARYGLGHYGSHRGEFPKARDMYRDTRDVFRSLPKGSYKVSKGSCSAYVAEMDRLVRMKDRQRRERVCMENMGVLLRMVKEFQKENQGELPTEMSQVMTWITEHIDGDNLQQNVLERNKAALKALFYCSAIADPEPLIGYVFQLGALPLEPAIACLWHRGRYLHKIDTDGGFHVSAQDLDSPVVDSLIIAGVFGR